MFAMASFHHGHKRNTMKTSKSLIALLLFCSCTGGSGASESVIRHELGATDDVQPDAASVADADPAPTIPDSQIPGALWLPASAFMVSNGTATPGDGTWTSTTLAGALKLDAPVPCHEGQTVTYGEAFFVMQNATDISDAYRLRLRYEIPSLGATQPPANDLSFVQKLGSPTTYPSVDSIVLSTGLPATCPSGSVWLRFEAFETTTASPRARFLGARVVLD